VSKHRSSPLRRRGRLGGLGLALAVTIAVGGTAVGVLPQVRAGGAAAGAATTASQSTESSSSPSSLESATLVQTTPSPPEPVVDAVVEEEVDPAPPADSGEGRRVVFDQGDQRVWLVEDDGTVARTYLVSGSRFDNLDPGAYEVLSTSRTATAFDLSGTMEYFVRFATGYSEPIGFHSVPRDTAGRLEQTRQQLGTPLSAGCVRQWKPDAVALWDFAPVGTTVVVTA